MSNTIHFPTKEEEDAALEKFFASQRVLNDEVSKAIVLARPAMERLAEVLCGRSGQPYKVRSILWSLYNGKPTKLEIVCLDWQIRKDLLAVMLAFGANEFFYKELKAAVDRVSQWDWFAEEGGKA